MTIFERWIRFLDRLDQLAKSKGEGLAEYLITRIALVGIYVLAGVLPLVSLLYSQHNMAIRLFASGLTHFIYFVGCSAYKLDQYQRKKRES